MIVVEIQLVMKLSEYINKFQVTKAVAKITIALATVAFGAMAVPDIEKISKGWLLRQTLFYIVSISLIFLVIVILIELMWITLSPKSAWIKKILGRILDKIQVISKLVFKILYIFPLSFFLRPAIDYILKKREEQQMNGELFEFVNQGVGRRDDDHYFPRVVNTKDLLIYIQPTTGTPRWRFGIKFSNDSNLFTTGRYDEAHPLFHLTKEENENSLRYNLYLGGKNDNSMIIEKYADTRCSIKVITNSVQTVIQVYDDKESVILKKIIPAQHHGQIFAWADGRSTFKLAGVIVEK